MSEYKLVLTDLDGTVVPPESNVASKAVLTAIQAAKDQGVALAGVTGRPFWMAEDLVAAIGFEGPSIFEGGGTILNPLTKEVIWERTVSAATTKNAVGQLIQYASIIEFGAGVQNARKVDLNTIVDPALSIWASVPRAARESLVDSLSQLADVSVHANDGPAGDFTRTGIQVTHIKADKEHAVKELLRLLSIDKKHTIAIGDGDNDLPLFRAAGYKVAMGNASKLLIAQADVVVADVGHDGFAEAIQRFVLDT